MIKPCNAYMHLHASFHYNNNNYCFSYMFITYNNISTKIPVRYESWYRHHHIVPNDTLYYTHITQQTMHCIDNSNYRFRSVIWRRTVPSVEDGCSRSSPRIASCTSAIASSRWRSSGACRVWCATQLCIMDVVRSTCAGQVIFFLTQLVVRRPGMWPSSLIHREAGQHGQVANDVISDKSR